MSNGHRFSASLRRDLDNCTRKICFSDRASRDIGRCESPVRWDLTFISSGKYDGIDEVTEPKNRHWRLLANVTRGMARASKDKPVLLLLDDLQWADPGLETDQRMVEVDISAMGRDDMMMLVEQQVGEPLGQGELGGLLADESGGNPFMARELVALLMEEEVLVKKGGEWRLTRKVEKIGIPRTPKN